MLWDRARKRYIYAHRLAVEAHLGRWLHSDEVVHHRNHNKHDNHLENLELTNRSDHMREHAYESGFGKYPRQPKRERVV